MTTILDTGYVTLVESWGSDERIIEAARMSTAKGFNGWGPTVTDEPCQSCDGLGETDDRGWALRGQVFFEKKVCAACGGDGKRRVPGDEKLLRYLYENKHATPFEMAGMTIEVKAPIFVFREWHRHRTQCLSGDTMVHFESPKGEKHGRRYVYKMPIAEVWRKWQPTTRASRPERQENALWSRSRIAGMRIRCADEDTGEVVLTRIVDVIRGGQKNLLRVTTVGGKTIRATAEHRFFTNLGWLSLGEAISRGAMLAVERTEREMAMSWETPPIDEATERWLDAVGWEGIYEVSNAGRVRRVGHQAKRGTVGSQGYPVVSLNRPGVQQTRTIHSLVLEAWKGPRPNGAEARHLNSNRIDCRADNLEWGSAAENATDRIVSNRQQRLTIGFDEIACVRDEGFEVTYDIAVEGPWHNFVADGFVVHNSYNEMSARYVPLPDENYTPTVDRVLSGARTAGTNKQAQGRSDVSEGDVLAWLAALCDVYEHAQHVYEHGIRVGVPKELARLPVPVARYSRMQASANLRNWLGFLTLRMAPAAQWEIRQYANAVGDLIAAAFPRTWALFSEGRPT